MQLNQMTKMVIPYIKIKKLIIISIKKKKIHTESRPGNDNYDMVTCTLVEEKLK